MTSSTNTAHIDGIAIRLFDPKSVFSLEQDDNFTRWVVRPLALLAVVAVGVGSLFASAMLILMSLALLPFLAVAAWAMKRKLKRDLPSATPTADLGSQPAS